MEDALVIRELAELPELADLAELLQAIWGNPYPFMEAELLRALVLSGNYVCGAYAGGRLVGGLVGFWGRHDEDWHLHSHVLGVVPGMQGRGVGFALKQHQRSWCLERGVRTIRWTFDPLVGRNGYFNVSRLGAEVTEYHVDLYGPMEDAINERGETDRAVVTWRLDSARAVQAAEGQPPEAERRSALWPPPERVLLDRDPTGGPLRRQAAESPVCCRVPDDIVLLRRRSPELARRWRVALRETLGRRIQAGWRVSEVSRDGWYVLEAPGSSTEGGVES